MKKGMVIMAYIKNSSAEILYSFPVKGAKNSSSKIRKPISADKVFYLSA